MMGFNRKEGHTENVCCRGVANRLEIQSSSVFVFFTSTADMAWHDALTVSRRDLLSEHDDDGGGCRLRARQ